MTKSAGSHQGSLARPFQMHMHFYSDSGAVLPIHLRHVSFYPLMEFARVGLCSRWFPKRCRCEKRDCVLRSLRNAVVQVISVLLLASLYCLRYNSRGGSVPR